MNQGKSIYNRVEFKREKETRGRKGERKREREREREIGMKRREETTRE